MGLFYFDVTHTNQQSRFVWQGQACPLQSPKAFRINAKDSQGY